MSNETYLLNYKHYMQFKFALNEVKWRWNKTILSLSLSLHRIVSFYASPSSEINLNCL